MKELFCIASGPSLTKEDCQLIKNLNVDFLAVNDSWKLVPWCDYLYAGDYKWWRANFQAVPKNIQGITSSPQAATMFNLELHKSSGPFNSGMRSLLWAMAKGYKKIFLLGFDCSVKNGVHWHGLHDVKKGLSNPKPEKMIRWQEQFMRVYAKTGRLGIEVINCSRYTELTCFKIAKLEDVLPKEEENSNAD